MAVSSMTCDLCGSGEFQELLRLNLGRSMLSHRQISTQDLDKRICLECGLGMNSKPFSADQGAFYGESYVPSNDHVFYTSQGPVRRAEALRDWIVDVTGEKAWRGDLRCLEVGAGNGDLLASFAQRFPQLSLEGQEPGRQAAQAAASRNITLCHQDLETFPGTGYDIVYSVAVLEHVASPTQFLRNLRARLKPGGLLIKVIPTQAVPSYDLFFIDHVHHFGTRHMRELGRKTGFQEIEATVGHPLMPNFAVHVFRAGAAPEQFRWQGEPETTCCTTAAYQLLQDFTRLDRLLGQLNSQNRRLAVFGLHEAYSVLRTYSSLWNAPIICGLSDSPADRSGHAFPVFSPESCVPVDDVLLTLNRVHYGVARERLRNLEAKIHEVFSA